MRILTVLTMLLLLLTACATEPPTPSAETVMTAIAGTQIAYMSNTPELVAPENGAVFEHPVAVILEWEWQRGLVGDEAYDVRVWRDGEPHNGITWTYQNQFDMSAWLTQQEPGEFFWSVAVIGGADGTLDRTVTNETEPFRFTLQDNQIPTPTPTVTPTTTPTPTPTIEPTATPRPVRPVPAHSVDVPPGFWVNDYARVAVSSGVTAITFGPDGLLYVLEIDGNVYQLIDEDGDGVSDQQIAVFVDEDDDLGHAVGIVWHEETLYISANGKIVTLADADADGVMDSVTPIVEGFVSLLYWGHSNNGIAFSPTDGKLYVGIGATTDHGPIEFPDEEAVVMRMNPDGSNLEVFARGFRNPYDLAFAPDGALFTADNGPDQLDETLREYPSEELNHIVEGGFYGFPEVYGDPPPGHDSIAPVTNFFPSVGNAGLTYYDADQFPPEFRNGLFVAQSGTRGADRRVARSIHNGFAVVFVSLSKTEDGTYEGDWVPFATFNQDIEAPEELGNADYLRPVDVAVAPDGSLFMAEFNSSLIYRVVYDADTLPPTPTIAPEPDDEPLSLVEKGETIFQAGAGAAPACTTCHVLDESAEAAGAGPSLVGRYADFEGRIDGLSVPDYIRQSITDPSAYLVDGYENLMYPDYSNQLDEEEIDALVEYVLALATSS
jgi:glucose/arabinose dehydrogenase